MVDGLDVFRRIRESGRVDREDPDFHLVLERYAFARNTIPRLNSCIDDESRRKVLEELLGHPLDPSIILCTPFYTDWGMFISIGRNTFINGNCTMLDQGGINIGEDVLIGPGVSIITAGHPLDPSERRNGFNRPVVIEDNVWIGANSTILPGVTIGRNSVVAACSVVTRDVPPDTLVMGHPARVQRNL
ncbi:MAG: sugar O-acetyltransferase [archaeon]|nr:sugar O-acetyltransferase [archaeon]